MLIYISLCEQMYTSGQLVSLYLEERTRLAALHGPSRGAGAAASGSVINPLGWRPGELTQLCSLLQALTSALKGMCHEFRMSWQIFRHGYLQYIMKLRNCKIVNYLCHFVSDYLENDKEILWRTAVLCILVY